MLDRPKWFIVINIIIHFVVFTLFSLQFSLGISISFTVFILLYNLKYVGWRCSIGLAIVYSMLFDSPLYTFTTYNVRFWYLLLGLGYCILALQIVFRPIQLKIRFYPLFNFLIILFLFILSFRFIIIENTIIAKLYNIKYWAFYVFAILYLVAVFKPSNPSFSRTLDYFYSLFLFVGIWGIFQYFFNIQGIYSYMYHGGNLRPIGFFSETTWYAEFLVFGLIFSTISYQSQFSSKLKIVGIAVFTIGIVLSATRNAYVSLVIALVIYFMFFLLKKGQLKINFRMLNYGFFSTLFFLAIVFLFRNELLKYILFFVEKMSLKDVSAQGRVLALGISFERILENLLLGNGFHYSIESDLIRSSGSSIGAKSFNLFLMILHIFGLIGFLPFLLLIFFFLYVLIKNLFKNLWYYYSLLVMAAFLSMSMFAPIHQYPIGIYIVLLSILFYSRGKYELQNG